MTTSLIEVEKRLSLAPVSRLLLDPPEAAASLGLSERTLWSLTQSGEIPSLKIGRLVRYSPAALQRWIDAKLTTESEG